MASLLILQCAWAQTAPDKVAMLKQLSEATKAQLPGRASTIARANHIEAAELAIDLIFYRWAARANGLSSDVSSIDRIVNELVQALGDPVADWTMQMFPITSAPADLVKLPPQEDERVTLISDLRREYGKALDYKDSSPVQAVAALVEAQDRCHKLRLSLSEALVMTDLGGHYLYNMSRYREAESDYTWATHIFVPCDFMTPFAQASAAVYDHYGFLNAKLGRTAAVENYTSAAQKWIQLSKQAPDKPFYLTRAGQEFMKAGAAQWSRSSDKALELMNSALDYLWQGGYATKDFDDYITSAISVSQFCTSRGNTDRALKLLNRAKDAGKRPLLTADVYDELSRLYKTMGQLGNSTEATRKRNDFLGQAASLGDTAIAKLEQSANLSRQARTEAERAAADGAIAYQNLDNSAKSEQLWSRLAAVQRKAGQIEEQARCLQSLARVLDAQGKTRESLDARLEAAIAVRSRNKALARDIGLEMVQSLVEAGDLNNALEAFRELVPMFQESGDVRGAAGMLDGRGQLLVKAGKYSDAIPDFQEARDIYLKQVGDPRAASDVSLRLAAAQLSADQRDQAQTVLESTLQEVERGHAYDTSDTGSDPERAEMLMGLYRQLVSTYVTGGEGDRAVALMKKAGRYAWRTELVNSLRSDSDPVVAQWAVTNLDILGGPDDNNPGNLPASGRAWATTWAEFWNTCVMLKSQHPAIYNALPIDPLDLLKSSQSIPKDSVIVAYLMTGASTYIFKVGSGVYYCVEVPVARGAISDDISRLRQSLKALEESMSVGIPLPSGWQTSTFLDMKAPLASLYSKLAAPLKDTALPKRLIFALPDDLEGLPMHALISSGSDPTPRFLAQDYEISYLGRAMLADLVGRDSRIIDASSDRLAVFADPDGKLPGALAEAKTIRGVYLNCQSYVGDRATATSFLKEAERCGILHIAAHHWIDPNPSRFELQLAPDGDSDGIVGVEQLSKLTNSRIGLMVLSACDTVSSSDPISSGPSRTAELLSVAGVKSTLGGLWKVSDEAAAELMGNFYRGLSRGQSRTEALQRAQILMIESNTRLAHPFFWACFALYGNPR